jgi:uncharacterized protein (DUF1778 family)
MTNWIFYVLLLAGIISALELKSMTEEEWSNYHPPLSMTNPTPEETPYVKSAKLVNEEAEAARRLAQASREAAAAAAAHKCLFDDRIFQMDKESKMALQSLLDNTPALSNALEWMHQNGNDVSTLNGNSGSHLHEALIFLFRFLGNASLLPFNSNRAYDGAGLARHRPIMHKMKIQVGSETPTLYDASLVPSTIAYHLSSITTLCNTMLTAPSAARPFLWACNCQSRLQKRLLTDSDYHSLSLSLSLVLTCSDTNYIRAL